jgi:hypothetical protein
MKKTEALILISNEVDNAIQKHPPFFTQHEGYAIIKEELDELWEEIKRIHNYKERNDKIRKEAIQVSAMALRFLIDLYEE